MASFQIVDEGIALIQLSAGKANAMSAEFLDHLDGLLEKLEQSDARAAVVTGYERFFSAGLALPTLIDLDRAAMRRFIDRFSQVMTRLFVEPRPVVAAINGHAIAGGCVMALMCDWRIMVDEPKSKIGLNEVQLGIGLPSVVIEALRLAVPPASLIPIAMEGQLFSPQRALELGLVHELVASASLSERAQARAVELATPPSSGVMQVKAALRSSARELMERNGPDETEAWLDSWFSPAGRKRLSEIVAQLGGRSSS
jgi:enoyl-CoA hydratase/carnithine racemase